MKIKVCFNNETHRISKAPETFEAFSKLISSIFLTPLPSEWKLEYMNQQQPVTIANENDYAQLLNSGLGANTIIKMFIIAKELVEEASTSPVEMTEEVEKKSQGEPQELQELEGRIDDKPSEVEMEQTYLLEDITNLDQSGNLKRQLWNTDLAELDAFSTKIKSEELLNGKIEEDISVKDRLSGEIDSNKKKEKSSKKKQKPKNQKKQKAGEKEYKKPNPNSKAQRLEDTIAKVIEKNIPKIVEMTQTYTTENKPKTTSRNTSVIHNGSTCAGCLSAPITGIRYKCLICPNFDLCEECEQIKEHPHALVKIKTPDQPYLLMGPPNSFIPPPLFMSFNPGFMPPPPMMQPPHFNYRNGPPPFRPPPPMYCKPGKKGSMPPMDQKFGGQQMNFAPFPKPCYMDMRNSNMPPQLNENMISFGMDMNDNMRPISPQRKSDSKEQANFIEKLAEDLMTTQEKNSFNNSIAEKRATEKFYSQETLTKTEQLKQLLPEIDKDVLLMFVDESPKEFDVLDLLGSFQ